MINIGIKDLEALWSKLGIKSGDLVMCHSFVAKLGKVTPSYNVIISSLLEVVGVEGTIIFPTFTYSYFNDEIYDIDNSVSTVGILGEIARKTENAVRSLDPCFSMVAIGKKANKLMKRENKNTFGEGSIYNKLLDENFKALLLGVDFTALSLFMHLERLLNVPYRYEKEFFGTSINKGIQFRDSITHYVRDLNFGFETNRKKIGNILSEDSNCMKYSLGYATHYCMDSQSIWSIVKKTYATDPFCLINKIV